VELAGTKASEISVKLDVMRGYEGALEGKGIE
jgi:hypothetical protein